MFKIGRYYKKVSQGGHPNNESYFEPEQIIHVVANTKTIALGECFIVEDANTDFVPVTLDIDTALWQESNKDDFVALIKSQSE